MDLNTINTELAKGRLKGGTYFSLFMYPPPRGDYFVIYDKENNEVHRFSIYIPIERVMRLTTDPAAPTFTMQKISEFHNIAHYLGLEV